MNKKEMKTIEKKIDKVFYHLSIAMIILLIWLTILTLKLGGLWGD